VKIFNEIFGPTQPPVKNPTIFMQIPSFFSEVGGMLALALLGSAATVMTKVAPFSADPDEGSNRRQVNIFDTRRFCL